MYIIIAGGGRVGFYLARELIAQGHELLVIEQNSTRAEEIGEELGNVVVTGNADEASTLADAGANRADVVVSVIGADERNLVICQVAKRRFNVPRTIARISNPRNERIFRLLGIDATVNTTDVILSVIEQEIPSQSLVPLLRLRHADVEIVEALLPHGSPISGRSLSQLDLPPESNVAIIIRGGIPIFPTGATILESGDEIIALTRSTHEEQLREAFFAK